MNIKKIKIAVIDTGVDMHDKEMINNLKFDRKLQVENFEEKYKNIDDSISHGTLCAKTILSICNDALIYPVKIFDKHGKTNSWNLVDVLQKILNTDIDIINISASTTNCPYEKELNEVCKKLYEEGKIIVCSHHNGKNNKSSIPTKFDTVIGVKGIDEVFKDKDYFYNKKNEVQVYGNSKERFLKFKGNIIEFSRNSRAAAVFSGILANMIKENGYRTYKLEELIMQNSINNKSSYKYEKPQDIYYDEEKTKIAKRLVLLINKEFAVREIDLNFLKEYSLLNTFTGIGNHNAYEFLLKINEEFNINIDYRDIFIYDLDYLNNIIEIIQKNLISINEII